VSEGKPDYGMPVHPVCDLFPMMDDAALAGLARDITANGLVNAIVLQDGEIVDGRNRLLACRSAGIAPRFVQWREVYSGNMSIERWIWSLNVERRHLTPDQIAWAIVQRRAWEEQKAARERQVAGLKQFHKNDASVPVEPPERDSATKGDTREVLAKEAGVSTNKVRQALAVEKLAKDGRVGPQVVEELKQGTVKLHEVLKRAPAVTPKTATPSAVPSAAPASDDHARSKRQEVRDNAAKRRMVEALSQIKAFCRGIAAIDAAAIRRVCSAEEIATWAGIARNAAKELRSFSSKLALVEESTQ
jgi:hypothetical protein